MSNKKASRAWILLRVSSVLLIPLFIWFVVSLFMTMPLDYAATKSWLSSPMNSLLMGIFVFIIYHHTWMGLHEVIEDYVRDAALKRGILLLLLICIIGLTLLSLHSLFSLYE